MSDKAPGLQELYAGLLARFARENNSLNAIVLIDHERVLRRVRELSARTARPNEHLFGVPVTVKENIAVRGLPLTAGNPAAVGNVAIDDAEVVQRLEAAGAVVVGKTNMSQDGRCCDASNPVYGSTRHPRDPSLSPGGSSGGGAAAVAAGLVPIDIGGDYGGSIRHPAALCGVLGLRPTLGLVSQNGLYFNRAAPPQSSLFNVLGPIARRPKDLRLALEAIAGPSEYENRAWSLALPTSTRSEEQMRVVFLEIPDWMVCESTVQRAYACLERQLSGAGLRTSWSNLAEVGDLKDLIALRIRLGTCNFGASLKPQLEAAEPDPLASLDDGFNYARREGAAASAPDFHKWLQKLRAYQTAFAQIFRSADVLVTPTLPVMKLPAMDHIPRSRRTVRIDGVEHAYGVLNHFCHVPGLVGFPALNVALNYHGWPVGFQLIGPAYSDLSLIELSALVLRYAEPLTERGADPVIA